MSKTTRITVALAAFSLCATGCASSNPYEGVEAEPLYQMGLGFYEDGNYDKAVEALDRLLISFGTSDRIVAARLLLGHSYYGKGDYLTARSEYSRFLDRFAGHPELKRILLPDDWEGHPLRKDWEDPDYYKGMHVKPTEQMADRALAGETIGVGPFDFQPPNAHVEKG